jgi:hypothetical protein
MRIKLASIIAANTAFFSISCGVQNNLTSETPQSTTENTSRGNFANWYSSNYNSIANTVGFTSNACAAFASTALSKFDYKVPLEFWAPSLPGHLKAAGFNLIDSALSLRAGDVVFTRDNKTAYDGLTPHVFVFHSFSQGGALAIDNQGNKVWRNLSAPGPKSWFWFAYRAPNSNVKVQDVLEQAESEMPNPQTRNQVKKVSTVCNDVALQSCFRSQSVEVCYRKFPTCSK